MASASVIVACYDQGELLRLALAAYARQSHPDFEVVVADDGSDEDYGELLRSWAKRFAHGIQHVSHEDRGFRKTRILNRAVAVARFERLIFTDADCLPHRHFVRDHVRHLAPRTVATGRRAHVERVALPGVEEILAGGLSLGPFRLLLLRLRGKARVIEHGFATPVFNEAGSAAILGSNFSAMKDDLVAVNGFNEEYQDWGHGEDTDIDYRLQLSGVRVRVFRNRMVQYHVAHAGARADGPRNVAIFERTRAQRLVRAAVGLAEIREGDFRLARYR